MADRAARQPGGDTSNLDSRRLLVAARFRRAFEDLIPFEARGGFQQQ